MEKQCVILTEDLTKWLYEEKLKWRATGYRYLNPSAVSSIEESMSSNTLRKVFLKRKLGHSKEELTVIT